MQAITNANGFAVARADHQAFGDAIGAGVGLRTAQQGYMNTVATRHGNVLTEGDTATGQRPPELLELVLRLQRRGRACRVTIGGTPLIGFTAVQGYNTIRSIGRRTETGMIIQTAARRFDR